MVTYIALLRGINVGGHRPLKMEDLRQMFSGMGYINISTYIQSGNIIFDAHAQDESELANKIQIQIDQSFGYEVPVIILEAEKMREIFHKYPFKDKDGWKRYITFLSEQPSGEQQQKLEAKSSDIEHFRIGDKAVYAFINKQADQKPLFSNNFIQRQLNMPVTNRNLRSVQKILELAFSDNP